MRLGCNLLARIELASAAGVRAPWSVGSCEGRDGPRAISIAHLRRASISSGLLSASDGTDGCAVVGTDLGSAGGPDPGGTVESGTDSVSADLGGAVGTDTGSVEREAAAKEHVLTVSRALELALFMDAKLDVSKVPAK
jgi:hypothetical protein